MGRSGNHKLIAGSAVSFFLLAFLIASFLAQDPQPSPSASSSVSPEPSPRASTTPPPRLPTPTPYPGAQNAHQWGSVTVFNGLPSDSVRAIAQTPDGVMWFGTDNGLARFDGRRMQKITVNMNGAEPVTALRTLPTGELLVGRQDGAWLQARGRFEIVANTQGTSISTIHIGKETLLGTDNGNVLRLSLAGSGQPFAAPLLAEPLSGENGTVLPVTSLSEVDGKILAATPGGGVFVIESGAASEFRTSPRPAFVNALTAASSGKLWMGTEAAKGVSGVFSAADAARAERIAAPTPDVFALEANDGGLWAGTERYGLFHFASGKLKKNYTFANTSGGLRSDTIYALFTDREGVLWIGTNRGVSRFDRMGPRQQTVSDSPNSNFIRTLYAGPGEEGRLLAGSNRGLLEYDGEGWNELQPFHRKVIFAIDSPSGDQRSLLVCTTEGVFDISGRTIVRGDARSIKSFQGKTYAAIYGRGVVELNGAGRTVFANDRVTSLGGSGGKLWIGTEDGSLFSFDGSSTTLEIGPDTLKSGTIWSVYDPGDAAGVWIGSQHGIYLVRGGTAEQIVAVEDVRDISSGADGHVWSATTTRGVVHARRDDRFGWLNTSIGFEQGLPSEKAFAIVPREGGNFLFATNRGVVTYDPGTTPPKLIAVRVLSQRVHDLSEISSPIELEYPQNAILIEVAGQSSRTFPEEFQYAYVLTDQKGREVDRRVSNDPQYSPQNLPAGEYTITATAFDRDLNPSDPLTIRFSVATAPFPWTATALGVLLAISLFGLAWAMIEHRRIRLRTNELAAARFDLANEAERERSRIARDLHDQTLADLRNLIINSDKLAGNGSFRSEIESVSTEIRRICEDLSPSVLENVGLVAALEFLLSSTVENGSFRSDDRVEENINFRLKVQLQIYRIAQEVLTNISKHSHADVVEMSVSRYGSGGFLLRIRDNGNTFQPAAVNGNGRGIANIRSRASLIGAKVKWKPDKDGRNVFTLKLEGSQAEN